MSRYRFYRRCPRPHIYRYDIFIAATNEVITWAEGEVESIAALGLPEQKRQLFERITRREAIEEGIHEARNARWLIGGLYLGENFEDTGQSEEELIQLSAAATERMVERLRQAQDQQRQPDRAREVATV